MKAQVIAELNRIGLYTASGSLGDMLAERIVEKVEAIRYFRSEGCDDLADAELTNTTLGPKAKDILTRLVATGNDCSHQHRNRQ